MSDEYDVEDEAVEKRASYVRANLPATLPFEAPSYLVQHMELADNGKQISWLKASLLVVGDSVGVGLSLFAVLTAVIFATFQNSGKESLSGFMWFLRIFATLYPGLAVMTLLTRSNEMCLRTEIYYLLIKYKIIIDWDNWGILPKKNNRMVYKTFFLWGWIASATLVAIFGCLNWQQYMDELTNTCPACRSFADKQNWSWLYQAFVVVLIVFQLFSFLAYFYGTLQVEEKGLITLNKSLEDKESGKFDRQMWTDFFYSDHADGNGTVVDFEEKEILSWAVLRYSQLPWQFKLWNPCRQDTKEAHVAKALSEWQDRGNGDLTCIHHAYLGNKDFAWHDDDYPGNWLMEYLVYRNLWGFCLLKTLMLHPDFSAAHAALKGLARWNATKVILSVLYMLGVEAFVIYWAWGAWI